MTNTEEFVPVCPRCRSYDVLQVNEGGYKAVDGCVIETDGQFACRACNYTWWE